MNEPLTIIFTELEKMLDDLGLIRQHAEDLKSAQASMLQDVKATPDWIMLEEASKTAASTINEYEDCIREATLQFYNADEDIPARTAVKQFTVVSIPNTVAAKEWCLAHFTPALDLNTKVFEKAAKDGNVPAALVDVTKEVRAQIASKLERNL